MLDKLDAGLRKIEKALVIFAGFVAVFGMLMITLDVILKRGFSHPITGSYEIMYAILMPLIICPVLAYVYAENVLPKFTLLSSKYNRAMKIVTSCLTAAVEIFVFALVFRYSFNTLIRAFAQHTTVQSGSGNLSTYPVYIVLPVGMGILFLQVIVSHAKHLREVFKNTENAVE